MKTIFAVLFMFTTFVMPIDRPIPLWYVHFRNADWERKTVWIYPAVQPEDVLPFLRKEYGEVYITCMAHNYYDVCQERIWE